MKKYIDISAATFAVVFAVSCAPQGSPIYRGSGVTNRTVSRPAPKVASAKEVFGNQPIKPTSDTISSTWGATAGSEYWWNDSRRGDKALLQKTSPNEPVLVSRESGYMWRSGCFNRVAPAEATVEEVIAEQPPVVERVVVEQPQVVERVVVEQPRVVYQPQIEYRTQTQVVYQQPTVYYRPQRYCPPPQRIYYRPQPRYYLPPRQLRYCPPPRYYRPQRYCPSPPRIHYRPQRYCPPPQRHYRPQPGRCPPGTRLVRRRRD